jgi:hypothetical protein
MGREIFAVQWTFFILRIKNFLVFDFLILNLLVLLENDSIGRDEKISLEKSEAIENETIRLAIGSSFSYSRAVSRERKNTVSAVLKIETIHITVIIDERIFSVGELLTPTFSILPIGLEFGIRKDT